MSSRATRWCLTVAVGIIVAAGIALLVAGRARAPQDGPVTSPAETTGAVPLPAIEWQKGVDPRESDDPWVAALFELLARDAAAFNDRDFSDERLRALADDSLLTERAADSVLTVTYYAGPIPAQLLDVEVSADATSATLTVCQMQLAPWSLNFTSKRFEQITGIGIVYAYDARTTADEGIQFSSFAYSSIDGRTQCDLDEAAVGYFNDVQSLGAVPTEVIGPDGVAITRDEVERQRWDS